jgi:NADH-quinone oxidoreductase subunit L
VSQLGYMFAAVGVGAYVDGVFHLMTHAFFKGCLFLGAGSVIHAMGGVQDMRMMGGLRKRLPITFWTFLAATLAICGIPPFAGFMSKDAIIWDSFARGHPGLWGLLWVSAGITAFYMFRQVYMTFFGEFRGTPEQEHHLHESPPSMMLALVVLGGLSVIGGFVELPGFLERLDPLGHPFAHFLAPVFASPATRHVVESATENRSLEAGFGALSLALVAAGWFLADLIYRQGLTAFDWVSELWGGALYRTVRNKYYVDEVYAAGPVAATLEASRAAAWFDVHIIDWIVNFAATLTVFSSWLSGLLDRYVVDGLVNLASNITLEAGGRMRRLQTGSINGYLYGILAAVTLALIVRAVLRA